MEVKICPKCREEKSFDEFFRNKSKKYGLSCECKACDKKRSYAYKKNNCGKADREWRARNPDKVKTYISKSADVRRQKKESDPEYRKIFNERAREQGRESVSKLQDYYILRSLRMNKSNATPELIELKRQQIIIHRLLKEVKNAAKTANQ